MSAALVAGFLAGLGIAVPVGAIGAYLVALTARTSFRTGAAAALGVATADGFYAVIAVAGGSALAPLLRPVAAPLRWISALVLIVLAIHTARLSLIRYRARRLPHAGAEEVPNSLRAYLGLLGITLLNPLTVTYFAALILGAQSVALHGHLDRVVFAVAAFLASAAWQLLLAGGGTLLGGLLTGPRGRLGTGLVSSLIVGALAIGVMTGHA